MQRRYFGGVVAPALALVVSLGASACSSATEQPSGSADAEINVAPQTLDEGTAALAQVAELQARDPGNEHARQSLEAIQARLDVLNHLLARVEIAAGHTVSFYEPTPGTLTVSEKARKGTAPALAAGTLKKPVELYRSLARGAEPPAALVEAQQRAKDADSLESLTEPGGQSALFNGKEEGFGADEANTQASTAKVSSALVEADGPWFRDNGCFKTGDARSCLPNWWNGGYAQYNAKTSFITIAPFYGDWVQVRWQYKGTTHFTTTVYNGEWSSYYAYSATASCGTCGYYVRQVQKHRWDVLQAAGDGFHWSYAFKWAAGCIDQACDDWP